MRLRYPVRHLIAFAGGVLASPSSWIAGAIYLEEGGGGDTDPLVFLLIVLGVSCLASAAAVVMLDKVAERA